MTEQPGPRFTLPALNTPPSHTDDPPVAISAGGAERLDRIGPLWYDLRAHHAGLAPMWRDGLLAASFDGRKAELLSKSAGGDLLVLLATTAADAVVGYCVCTVTATGDGEVDSLYVAPSHRRRGVGRELMSRAMAWLGERSPQSIAVEVMACNDNALRLYQRYGFHARTVRMRHVSPVAGQDR
jgi:ribosomal protein S18 acetylase RimI-like enzyme